MHQMPKATVVEYPRSTYDAHGVGDTYGKAGADLRGRRRHGCSLRPLHRLPAALRTVRARDTLRVLVGGLLWLLAPAANPVARTMPASARPVLPAFLGRNHQRPHRSTVLHSCRAGAAQAYLATFRAFAAAMYAATSKTESAVSHTSTEETRCRRASS